jgi:anhydro-N-acetylmuramic acid kinase
MTLFQPSASSPYWIGLMSGTSMDGVDGVLLQLTQGSPMHTLAHVHTPFDPDLRELLMALQNGCSEEIHRMHLGSYELTRLYADTVKELLQASGLQATDIAAIGAHGQTIRHRPPTVGADDIDTYTLQILQPARLAEWTDMNVVCDFRSRDLAAGGQGAPLVPAFHQALFAGHAALPCAVVNIGGMANVSWLSPNGQLRGWDTGPGNVLMDGWMQQHMGFPMDENGELAQRGRVQVAFLERLLQHPYLTEATQPTNLTLRNMEQGSKGRSTGREAFNVQWVEDCLESLNLVLPMGPADVMATLCELTAISIVQTLPRPAPMLVCGGGALNPTLMARLQAVGAQHGVPSVHSTANVGVHPMQVEAAAFAWLAQQFALGHAANVVEVTGAAGPRVLGAWYPA